MSSVDGVCRACKQPVSEHLPSGVAARRDTGGKIDVVRGRCILVDGRRAPQKCCWAQFAESMDEAEYRRRVEAGTLVLEPCPCCGGRLQEHGQSWRLLADAEGVLLNELPLLRGLCANPDCPVCTVTHYPCFVTPYRAAPTGLREVAVRGRAEGRSWSELAGDSGYAVATVRRWVREVTARAAEVVTGLLAIWQRLDPLGAPAGVVATEVMLRAMFRMCDGVAALLQRQEQGQREVPRLSVPRRFRPAPPTTLPVWT